jgi:Cu2+-containing amine oxidase
VHVPSNKKQLYPTPNLLIANDFKGMDLIIKKTQLLLISLLSFQQAIQAESAQKYQSLSSQEKQSACLTVNSIVMPEASLKCNVEEVTNESSILRQDASASGNNTALNSIELLLVERRFSEKGVQSPNTVRMADVYSYNYNTDTLNYTIINIDSGQVLQSEEKQGVQLPLTENEISRSINIASENQLLHTSLEKEYLNITGQALQSFDQLIVKAFIFLAKSMPGQVNAETKLCGLHRCARLVMHTSERIALETAPIIDLSSGVVSQYKLGEQ